MTNSRSDFELPPSLSAEERLGLLRLARRALLEFLGRGTRMAPKGGPPAWRRPRAAFVTLRHRESGVLRGCRGESRARRPLQEAVSAQAIAAAVDDHRFPSVSIDELAELQIQISALTPPVPISPEQVVPGQHGLLLVLGGRSGLLLPQVALAHGLDRDTLLLALCRKAALPLDAMADPEARLLGFEAEVWGEEPEVPLT